MVVEVAGTAENLVVVPKDINGTQGSEYQPDTPGGTYSSRATPGGPTNQLLGVHTAGTSVRALIQRGLGARFPQVTGAAVIRPDGTSEDDLDSADLQAPGTLGYPFPPDNGDPAPTPMFFVNGSDQVGYNRPLRGLDDTNATPNTFASSPSSTSIVVRVTLKPQRDVVQPVITASPSTVALGKPIAFSISSYRGPQPSEQLHYYWAFGDTTNATTNCSGTLPGSSSAPSHTYSAKGSYQVRLTVCGSHTSGASSPISVRVGPVKTPPKKKAKTPPNTSRTKPPKSLDSGQDGSDGKHAGGTTSAQDGAGGRGDQARQGSRGQQKGQSSAGVAVSGTLLDAEAATSVTLRAPAASALAAAPLKRGGDLPQDWVWLLALTPLALLLGGVARQTPWLAARLPRPPWRDV